MFFYQFSRYYWVYTTLKLYALTWPRNIWRCFEQGIFELIWNYNVVLVALLF